MPPKPYMPARLCFLKKEAISSMMLLRPTKLGSLPKGIVETADRVLGAKQSV